MKKSYTSQFFVYVMLLAFSTATPALAQQKQLDQYFTALYQNQQFNGNVLVCENDKVVYRRSFGYRDFIHKTPFDQNSIFPFASLTKTITSTAILQLEAQGKLSVSDPVEKYLSDFPYKEITVKNLLSHTSGLPPYEAFFDSLKAAYPRKVFTNADFMKALAAHKKPLIYQPGEQWNYENVNFLILALIIEKVSGMPYKVYIEDHITGPAGMKNTYIFPPGLQFDSSVKKNNNFVIPHIFTRYYQDVPLSADKIPYVASYWHTYQFNGFADFVGTTTDLLNYDRALYAGNLLNTTALNRAFIPAKLNNGTDNPILYALGWAVEKDTTMGKIVYHTGNDVGLSCDLIRNMSKHQTVIIVDIAHPNAHFKGMNAMRILNKYPVEKPKKSVARIYCQTLVKSGPAAATATLERLRKDTVNYVLDEDEMNFTAYDLITDNTTFHFESPHLDSLALEIFRTNTILFPASWNAFDSYGEILLKLNKKQEAKKMYQKSLELNPKNDNAEKIIRNMDKN